MPLYKVSYVRKYTEGSKERQTEKRLQITESPDLHRILAYIRASLLLSGEKSGYLINDANILGKGKQNWDPNVICKVNI